MKGITSSVRRPARWAILPAVAMIGVLAGLTNAFARDQQATGAELDDQLNWMAARGGSYADTYAANHESVVHGPQFRNYR